MMTNKAARISSVSSLAYGVLPLWLYACTSSGDGSPPVTGADSSSEPLPGGAGTTTATSGAAGNATTAAGVSSVAPGQGGSTAVPAGGGAPIAGAAISGGGNATTSAAMGAGGDVGGSVSGAETGGTAGSAGATETTGGAGGTSAGGSSNPGGGSAGAEATAGGSPESAGGSPSASCPASATAAPGETTESITVDGRMRTFIVHVPPDYTGDSPVPVVIDFHPLGGTGSQQRGLGNWGSLADREGFIVVWPDGVGNSWNVGRCCDPAQSDNVDDVAFTRAIIENLQGQACIDPKRVYATGCSNGGGMAYKVACDAADVIAAAAPVDFDCLTGPTNDPSCAGCSPSRPISEIQFRGTNDSAVPYEGGPTPVVPGLAFPGAEANLETWGELNMCTGDPQALPDHSACSAYPMCGGNVDTVLCTVQNGTHCGNYQSFGIIDIAWEMFQNEALP